MNLKNILGVIFLVAGIALLVYGYTEHNSMEHQLRSIASISDNVKDYFIAGAASAIVGGILLIIKIKR